MYAIISSAVLPTVFSMKWVCCNVGFQVSLFFLSQASAKELAESVDLLLQLQEPADSLCAEFLAHAETYLGEQLCWRDCKTRLAHLSQK